MIQNLHYDYSSWSLRDTYAGGSAKDKDPVRIQAKEILEATITELESLGLPQEKKEQQKIRELLEDELTGKQAKEIDACLKADDQEKTEKIAEILETLSKENLAAVSPNFLHHRKTMPENQKIAIVILNWNGEKLFPNFCLPSFEIQLNRN
jgi:biopolymer transport protein ExbD